MTVKGSEHLVMFHDDNEITGGIQTTKITFRQPVGVEYQSELAKERITNPYAWLSLSLSLMLTSIGNRFQAGDIALNALPDLRHNDNMACGCHLPAFVDYMKQEYSRYMNVYGSCLNDQNRLTDILQYSQCENYKLFQQNLQCETCSTNKCTDSDVTICPGAEPVCQNTISMTGVTWKLERSCGTYRKCVESMRNNTLTSKTWSSGTSCVNCCTGKLCNKRGFYESHNMLEFHLIHSMTSGSQNRPLNEHISRSLEHEFLSMTGVFKVEYCGMQSNKEIFTIYCAVQNKIKDQVEQNIRDILNTSQTLHNLGLDQHNTEIIAICNEDTIFTDNIFFNWPMTKIGTSVTIPCHANIATRYCSYSTALHLGIPTSHSNTTQKCKPFTGVWQKPKMSQCNNTEWITQKLKDIHRQDINQGNIEKFSRQLRNISEKSLYFKEEDFNLAVDIHEKMVPLISRVSTNITLNYILLSINNMEDTPERILNGAEQASRSVTRMLDIIETIPDQISLEEQQVTVLYSNLGIGVIKVENDTFNGSSFGVLPGNPETKAKTLIYNSSQPEDTMKIFISLPRSLFQHLKSEEQSSISRISFFFIEDDKLYKVIQTSSTKEYNKSTSHIISANIPNIQITNLNEPVTVLFNSVYQNQQCAYWDESSDQKPRWSTNGCKTSNYVPGEKVVCSCNHLTSFTLLVGNNMTSHNYQKKWSLLSSKILICQCTSLSVVNIIFLIGMKPYALKITAACKVFQLSLLWQLTTQTITSVLHKCDKLRSDDRERMRMQGMQVVRK
ncbi:adhesion G-protein coupled receptor G6-like [Octopus vulgaris]|uniref:Adhesion G-protein coupled receptor G6-like n=1 Tax=Octopus vulgaris TaxID=6645 RepID=A0AA36AMS9_OCTVU|nr:adhesion G-protein coupled receptor G6-like [Octopus vulgaris]